MPENQYYHAHTRLGNFGPASCQRSAFSRQLSATSLRHLLRKLNAHSECVVRVNEKALIAES
jgi:hypothetical protein